MATRDVLLNWNTFHNQNKFILMFIATIVIQLLAKNVWYLNSAGRQGQECNSLAHSSIHISPCGPFALCRAILIPIYHLFLVVSPTSFRPSPHQYLYLTHLPFCTLFFLPLSYLPRFSFFPLNPNSLRLQLVFFLRAFLALILSYFHPYAPAR